MVGLVIDELSGIRKKKIDFYKVNIEKEQELAGMFDIQSILSLPFIPVNGEPKTALGALPKKELERIIDTDLMPSISANSKLLQQQMELLQH